MHVCVHAIHLTGIHDISYIYHAICVCVPGKERAIVADVLFLSNTGDNPTPSTKPNTYTLVSWSHSILLTCKGNPELRAGHTGFELRLRTNKQYLSIFSAMCLSMTLKLKYLILI